MEIDALFPDPQDASVAARQVRIVERSKVLFTTGKYTWYVSDTDPYVFGVCGPAGQHYKVDMRANNCSCAGFQEDKDCKHRLAVAHDPDCYNACICKRFELEELPYLV